MIVTNATASFGPAGESGRDRTRIVALPALDRLLDDLPAEFCVASHDVLRLVVGPPGVFVLSSERAGSAEQVAGLLIRASIDVREMLADHLGWGPFVDALFVTDHDGVAFPTVTGVPFDLLRATLLEGHVSITERQLIAVRQLLRDDRLDPWTFCLPGTSTIDLSDPVRHATTLG